MFHHSLKKRPPFVLNDGKKDYVSATLLAEYVRGNLSYQNAYHQDMTPDMVNWRKVRKSDAYGVPIIFIVLGIACVAAAVFGG